jgi:DNA-binding CsgD family transcriptional regulator
MIKQHSSIYSNPFAGRTHEHLDTATRTIDSIVTSPQNVFRAAAHAGAQAAHQPLVTAREREILELMAAGMTNPEIAAQLVIGVGTVKTHTLHIYRKLEVGNRTQAIDRAYALGILQASSHNPMLCAPSVPHRRQSHRPLSTGMHDHIEGLIADALAQIPASGLDIQEKYGVMYLHYWFDQTRDMVFCFVEAHNKAAAIVADREAQRPAAGERMSACRS